MSETLYMRISTQNSVFTHAQAERERQREGEREREETRTRTMCLLRKSSDFYNRKPILKCIIHFVPTNANRNEER